MEAALALVAKHGFELTSYQQIADQCRLQQTSLFRYFKNRDELLSAMLERVVEISQDFVTSEVEKRVNSFDKVKTYTDAMGTWVFEDSGRSKLLLLMFYNATFSPFFSKYHQMFSARAKERIEVLLKEGEKSKELILASSPAATARVLHQWLMGAYIDLVTEPKADLKHLTRFKKEWDFVFSQFVSKRSA